MCDKRPGPRCSDYATSTLKITKARLDKVDRELSDYETKYAESLAAKEPTPRDKIRQDKHARLQESKVAHQKVVDAAEFEYYSCPVGQADLKEKLQAAIDAEDVPLQEELEVRAAAGEDYRASNRENLRKLEEIEKEHGVEAAEEAAWKMYETAAEEETEAIIMTEKSRVELDAARAEAEEYERAMEEYRKNDRIDTPEEEREKARKRKMQIAVIGVVAVAFLTYSLVSQASGGKKSQLLQYGKSMMMRQVMTGGRQYMSSMMKGGKKEADAREMRAEREAEQRAAQARERVVRKHEQGLVEEERKQLRDEERASELAFKNTIREAERAAERQKRAEELAHAEAIAQQFKDLPLTPEMQAFINSKKPPTRAPRSNQGNGNRQYSNRRQGQSNVSGSAVNGRNENTAQPVSQPEPATQPASQPA